MTTSQGIFDWMEENKDFFKPQGICKRVDIDKSNFSKYKKEKKIPEKYLQPIMELIMPLGFTLDKIIKENNKPENKARILAERNGIKEKQFEKLLTDKLKENEVEISKTGMDLAEIGVAITHTDENGKATRIDPLSDKGEIIMQIAKLEERLKLSPKYLPKWERIKVESQLLNLKRQLQ